MLKNKLLKSLEETDGQVNTHAVNTWYNDQLLSAATELCLIYLECEKILKKHERVLDSFAD